MTSFDDLSHASIKLSSGGEVLVLDTGAVIGPESQAMLGALYSRSPKGIREHLKILAQKGPGQFMETFYVGYGHKSIGDLGTVAIFVDGVSMLGAKAIQDFPLYNGQESSTRYIDFSKQPFIDPVGTDLSHSLLEELREFYIRGFNALIPDLEQRFPREEHEDEKVYGKAIRARAFDIMRAFLPAGAMTNVAWMGELRQVADRLPILRNHPLAEIREVGEKIEQALVKMFPHSFSGKRYELTEQYHALCQRKERLGYYNDKYSPVEFECGRDTVDRTLLIDYHEALRNRPPKTELPWEIRECGTLQYNFLLDFGSFRDLQRQRAVVTRMPLLTDQHGFEEWYLNELPIMLRLEALTLLQRHEKIRHDLNLPATLAQYYLPMGMKTTIRMTGDLRALVYLVELRATRFVHPTLRKRALQIAGDIQDRFRLNMLLHLDADPDRFDVKRGTHDIVEKT